MSGPALTVFRPARSRSRMGRAILCLAVLAFAGTAVTAAAEPRARELWKAFPLDAQQGRDARPAPSSAPGPARPTTREAQTPAGKNARPAAGVTSTARQADNNLQEIVALSLVALLGTGVLVVRFSRQRSLAGAGGQRLPAGLLPGAAPVPALTPPRRSVPIRDFSAVADGDVGEASQPTPPATSLVLPLLANRGLHAAEPPYTDEHDRSDPAPQGPAERAARRVDPPAAETKSSKNDPSTRVHVVEPDVAPGAATKPATPRQPLQRCAIVSHRSGQTARFAVVPVVTDSRVGPPTAWSRSFAVSRAGDVSNDRRARRAHDALVAQLAAVGWRQEDSGEEWYEAVFVRDIPERSGNSVNAAVVCRRLGNEARFEAIQLDDYGNATRLAASPPFSARRRGSARPTAEARALHAALVRYLRRLGWEADQSPDGDWYATPLKREQS
jgi:hypothetical protein